MIRKFLLPETMVVVHVISGNRYVTKISINRGYLEKMVYSGFMKFISMVVYPFPIHVVLKGFWVGQGSTGGCALFKPFGFRDISHFQAKKSSGGSLNRPAA
ncbi:hypothetical protein RHGRI_012375 [Rhododendron griersonianum]|uniref:Uncharacterized protein n=1 Tax=Rhododendron griersonianum TaxID=479676 RepID=A0AAV6KRB7_9ERIC|nr:hypothetical protein RHGRI_012375 [Rhododendron griersonianum]